jgi:hypothetical protein
MMDKLSLEQKLEQFDEFFSIKHAIKVNMRCLPIDFVLPHIDELVEHMPYAFKVASELVSIESKALRPLRNMGEHAGELAEFLNHLNRKIDLMMSLILQQQDDPALAHESYKFGGGGIVIISKTALPIGQGTELKLFIKEEASAIFCFAEVIACQKQDDSYHVSLIYTRIREQDQDLLVRASLHLQAANLRKRNLKLNKDHQHKNESD